MATDYRFTLSAEVQLNLLDDRPFKRFLERHPNMCAAEGGVAPISGAWYAPAVLARVHWASRLLV